MIPRYIEATNAHRVLCEYYNYRTVDEKYRLSLALSHVPTVDVMKVVRCKDCKHRPYLVPAKYDSSGKCIKYAYITSPDDVCPFLCDDPWYNRIPEDNFFCGLGDRKEKKDVP